MAIFQAGVALDKSHVGLSNVDNLSSADIRSATATNVNASNFVGVVAAFAQSAAPTGW